MYVVAFQAVSIQWHGFDLSGGVCVLFHTTSAPGVFIVAIAYTKETSSACNNDNSSVIAAESSGSAAAVNSLRCSST